MANKITFLLLLWAGIAFAAKDGAIETNKDGNNLVNGLLEDLGKLSHLNEADLEDIDVDIKKQVFIVSIIGSARLSEGSVKGVSVARRVSKSKVTKNLDNSTTVVAVIEHKRLDITYNRAEIDINPQSYNRQYFNGSYVGTLKKLRSIVVLRVDDVTGDLTVQDVTLKGIKDSSFRIQGEGFLHWRYYAALDDLKKDIIANVVDVIADSLREAAEGKKEVDETDAPEETTESGVDATDEE